MSQTTQLGEVQLGRSGHDVVSITLEQPADFPASVLIHWPVNGPTVVDPKRFGDTASAIVKMFSEAHVKLAALKARRRL